MMLFMAFEPGGTWVQYVLEQNCYSNVKRWYRRHCTSYFLTCGRLTIPLIENGCWRFSRGMVWVLMYWASSNPTGIINVV